MSFLNKIGLEKVSVYNDLVDQFNMQGDHILSLETEIMRLNQKMEGMSEVPRLRSELDYLNERWERMKAKHSEDYA